MIEFTSHEDAINHATETGEHDGETLYNENRESYRDEEHAVSGLIDCASEAASVLRVPSEHYGAWVDAYAAAAERVIRTMYNA